MSQGVVRRKDKEVSPEDAEAFLKRAALAHFATVGPDGYPYVIPNLFVYADKTLHTHTASATGHFRRNIEHCARISVEAAEMGQVFPYGAFECDTSVSYMSVVGFGSARIVTEHEEKSRFFDRLLAKYGDPAWNRPRSFYPRLDDVTVYRIDLERLTGKTGPLPAVADQWPTRNRTMSPYAVSPGTD